MSLSCPLSVALFHARQRYDFIWVGCAILGLVLLFPLQQAQQHLDLVGVFCAVAAGACWALYIIAGQKPSGISGNHTVCLGMSIGMLCLLPFALAAGAIDRVFELPNLYYFIGLAILAKSLTFYARNDCITQFESHSSWYFDELRTRRSTLRLHLFG